MTAQIQRFFGFHNHKEGIMKNIIFLLVFMLITSNAFAMFGYVTEKSTEHVIGYFNLKEKPKDTKELKYTVCLESSKPELYKEPVTPKFEAQLCENDLYTKFLPTLSDGDKTLLVANSSFVVITQCFRYNNVSAWNTLKLHLASLMQQGFSSEGYASFKQILLDNHIDLEA